MERGAFVVVVLTALSASAHADEPRYTCLSTSCENDWAAAYVSRADGTNLLAVGKFQHGTLIEGSVYELSANRTSRIDLDGTATGTIHRGTYDIELELDTIAGGIRSPRGEGNIKWREPVGTASTPIKWRNGVYQFTGDADLVQRAELDLVGTFPVDIKVRRLGGLVFVRDGQGAVVANVGRIPWFPDYSNADETATLSDGTTGQLVVADGDLRELPLPTAQVGRRWKSELRATAKQLRLYLTSVDGTLAQTVKGLAEQRGRDELRTKTGRMYSKIFDAVSAADGLVDRIPTREHGRRVAAFLLVRELAALQTAVEAAQDALSQAEVNASTKRVLSHIFGRPQLRFALDLVAKLSP